MKKLIIDYLTDCEHQKSVYILATDLMNDFEIARFDNPNNLLNYLGEINTDLEPVNLTFFSHGNINGLGRGEGDPNFFLRFPDILDILNNARTRHNLIVNFMANCESYGIVDYLNHGLAIDEFWYTTTQSMSIIQPLMAVIQNGDSDLFEELNENNSDYLFKQIFKV